MPAPSAAQLEKALAVVKRHGGNRSAAARELGMAGSTLKEWMYNTHRWRKPIPVDDTAQARIEQLEETVQKAVRPVYHVSHSTASHDTLKLVCIGDAHDDPKIDKHRFEAIGAYIDEAKPDVVIQIGDFLNMDSLNTHVPDHTFNGKAKPTFEADLNSFRLALDALESKLNWKCKKHCTLGNHERRLFAFEDNAPATWGMMQGVLQLAFHDRKWTYSPYGEIYMQGGVGFVHAALNTLGKTYGGKNAETTICNDSVFDLVIGHSHRAREWRAPKLGRGNFVQILNVGCALPHNHVEEYAQHALTGWSWGIVDMTIKDGHIHDHRFLQMDTLEERYGGR